VLGSAALHAGWNTLIAGARDVQATTAVALLAGVAAMAVAALVLGGRLPGAALPFAAGSAVLELAYFALLAAAYAGAGLTAVYPIARGTAPVLALLVSVAFLGAHVGALQSAGVLAVAAGVVLVRGLRRPGDAPAGSARPAPAVRPARHATSLALAVGACIAGYTLVDDRALEHASPIPYFTFVLALTAAGFVAALFARRGRGALRAARGWRPVAAGVGMATAYTMALAALERAEAAPVAALRETSVVMATAAAALWGREQVSGARLAGAVAVVAGAAAIALG
jgi:drug/metabolite transporter (DMT)-like permease